MYQNRRRVTLDDKRNCIRVDRAWISMKAARSFDLVAASTKQALSHPRSLLFTKQLPTPIKT
jgi:hypothetical protein